MIGMLAYQNTEDGILLVALYTQGLDLEGYAERLVQTGRTAPATHPSYFERSGGHSGDLLEMTGLLQRLQEVARGCLARHPGGGARAGVAAPEERGREDAGNPRHASLSTR